MNIAVILVSFDPARNPSSTVAQIKGITDTIVIVDNFEGGHPAMVTSEEQGAIILRNDNVGGLAGAYNRALDWIEQHHKDTTHILFLDDDSDLGSLTDFLDSPATIRAAAAEDVAAVAPIYRDRRTGLRGRHIQLERFRFRFLSREHRNAIDVTFVINSMSLWRRDVLAKLGQYSVSLGIDHIDTDYAMRAKRAGYRIVLNAEVEFLHEIGKRRSYRILGRTVQSGGHSAARRFLIGRNTTVLAKTHGFAYPAFMLLCVQRLAYETIGILAVEDRKLAKLSGLVHGVFKGLSAHA